MSDLPEPSWLIFFEDQDMRPEFFTDESAAKARMAVLSQSWSCHLFVAIDRSTRERDELKAMLAAVRSLRENRDELKAKIAELEATIEPVKSWYDGGGKSPNVVTMLRFAIADLQTDRAENLALRAKVAELEKVYQTVKDWGHRLEQRLETIIARCDDYADGTPDATPLEKFANELIGLSNDISLGNVLTLKAELAASQKLAEMYAQRHEGVCKERDELEKALRRVLEWCEQDSPDFEIDADAIRAAIERKE